MRLLFSTPPQTGTRVAIFFDRDGIINEQIDGAYVTKWEQFRFVRGIAQLLANLSQLGLPMIVVSNQACVGKGLVSPSVLREITNRFVGLLKDEGARIDAVYYCLHTLEDDCFCRKPKKGLLDQAAGDWHLDLSRSILVGDSLNDVDAALAADCRAVLLDQTARFTRELGNGVLTARSMAEIEGYVSAHFHATAKRA